MGPGDALADAVEGADILVVYELAMSRVSELGPPASELAWIHAASAGVDAVLTPAVLDSRVVVTNAQGVFDQGIAELDHVVEKRTLAGTR